MSCLLLSRSLWDPEMLHQHANMRLSNQRDVFRGISNAGMLDDLLMKASKLYSCSF
jgi:hypothetical protein